MLDTLLKTYRHNQLMLVKWVLDSWSSGPAYSFNPSRIVKGPSFLFIEGARYSLSLPTSSRHVNEVRSWFMIQWSTVLPSRRLVGFREPFLHSIEISLFFRGVHSLFDFLPFTLFFIGHSSPFFTLPAQPTGKFLIRLEYIYKDLCTHFR